LYRQSFFLSALSIEIEIDLGRDIRSFGFKMGSESNENSDPENLEREDEDGFESDICFSLINLVQKHRCIYDLEDAGHKDSKHRIPEAWKEVAEGVKFRDGTQIKLKNIVSYGI